MHGLYFAFVVIGTCLCLFAVASIDRDFLIAALIFAVGAIARAAYCALTYTPDPDDQDVIDTE